VFDGGYIKTQARTFGDYYIKIDTIPPFIRPLNTKKGRSKVAAHGLFFKIGDNLSGVKAYIGKVDGKWTLTEWDYKTRVLSYLFSKELTAGKHTFDLTVIDNKDNSAHYAVDFNK
jgi:hypothetical protein